MTARNLTRRTLILAAVVLAVAPAQSAGPVTIWLSKQKIGTKYRVKIYAAVSAPGISIPKRYMGYVDVPPSGEVKKTIGSLNAAPGLMLKITTRQIQNNEKVKVSILAKTHALAMTLIRNI